MASWLEGTITGKKQWNALYGEKRRFPDVQKTVINVRNVLQGIVADQEPRISGVFCVRGTVTLGR